MVTVIGFVPLRTDNSLDPSEPRHFTIETSVYDASKAAPAHFSVVCFLEDTKRWRKVKTPASGALLTVTAKIAGRTRDTNLLALRVLDLAYLPRPASAPTPTPTDTPPSKRSDRWRGRVPSTSTPSKRPRISDPANEAANPSDRNRLGNRSYRSILSPDRYKSIDRHLSIDRYRSTIESINTALY